MAASEGSISTKERFWRGHMAGQAGTGLSIARYCEQRGLALSTFHVWRRRLQAAARAAEEVAIRPAGRRDARGIESAQQILFKEVRVEGSLPLSADEMARAGLMASDERAGVVLILSRPLRLRLLPGFDEESARRALRLAREVGEC